MPIKIAIKKYWFLIGLALIILLGVWYPPAGIAIKPWISKAIFVGMIMIGLRLDLSEVLLALTNWRAILVCLICGFVAMPLASLAIAEGFFRGDIDLYLGVILAGAVPTTQASSLIWTDMSQGNKNLALVLMTISNVIGVFISPLILQLLVGAQVDFPVVEMIKTLVLYILFPIALGQAVRQVYNMSQRMQSTSRTLNLLIVWATVLAALSGSDLRELPIVTVLIAVALQYTGVALLSFYGSKAAGLNVSDSLAVMFCSAQATITFAAVIGFSFFGARSIIYIVVYHLFQQMMGQVTANFMERRLIST